MGFASHSRNRLKNKHPVFTFPLASTAAHNPRFVPISRDKPVYATTSPSAKEKALTTGLS
jgi:hypothetical protein